MKPPIHSLPLFPTGVVSDQKPSGITLRKYQEDVIKKIRWHTTHGKKRLLLVAPCASGKMVMIATIIQTSTVPVLFVAHRRELLDQLVRELAKYGINHISIIRGDDDRFDPSATIQVASIQSLMRRDKPKAGIVFIDECHKSAADSYREHVFNAYPDAVIIGATATPSRLDGQPMGDLYEVMEVATTYSELLRLKHLIEPHVFGAPVVADLSGVRINQGDYNQEELGRVMGQQHLRGQLVQHWIERAHMHFNPKSGKWEPGPLRRTLVFASTVEHSRAICGDFARMGARVAHLDGETPDGEREAMLAKLAAGDLDIISNVNVLLEGIDIPAIKCIVHARPTQSLVLWIQSTARALRLWNGISPLILDHAGNAFRHGMPHDDRIWSLTKASVRNPGNAPTKMCPKCFAYVALSRYACPFCGHEFPEPEVRRQLPKETNEKLVQLSQGDLQRAFYDECVTKARTKGFKPGYAAAKFKEKMGHWPPFGWSESTKSSFASDPAWQQALAMRESKREFYGNRQSEQADPAPPPEWTQPTTTVLPEPPADVAQDWEPAPEEHEVDNDYLRDPNDAPFSAWLDEEGIGR